MQEVYTSCVWSQLWEVMLPDKADTALVNKVQNVKNKVERLEKEEDELLAPRAPAGGAGKAREEAPQTADVTTLFLSRLTLAAWSLTVTSCVADAPL